MRTFIEIALKELRWESIIWKGSGINKKGYRQDNGQEVIKIDPRYFCPSEVDKLNGDAKKAQKKLD